jgi:hypothetical protein
VEDGGTAGTERWRDRENAEAREKTLSLRLSVSPSLCLPLPTSYIKAGSHFFIKIAIDRFQERLILRPLIALFIR